MEIHLKIWGNYQHLHDFFFTVCIELETYLTSSVIFQAYLLIFPEIKFFVPFSILHCVYLKRPIQSSKLAGSLKYEESEILFRTSDFSLGWWNALASAWFPASAILKIWHCGSNFALVYAIVLEKPQMNIRETWHNCPWQYFRSFDHGIVILLVFMAPDRVVLPASRSKSHRKLLTCFLGAGGPWPVISRPQA